MIATEDERVDACIEIIRHQCGKRQDITVHMPYVSGTSSSTYMTIPTKVEVGGAIIMVANLERFEKD